MTIDIAVEPHATGAGGAIAATRDKLDCLTVLMNGDTWFDTCAILQPLPPRRHGLPGSRCGVVRRANGQFGNLGR